MVTGPSVGRVPVPGATNGTPQSVQGITAYQQRYVGRKNRTTCSVQSKKKKVQIQANIEIFLKLQIFMFIILKIFFSVLIQLGIFNSADFFCLFLGFDIFILRYKDHCYQLVF